MDISNKKIESILFVIFLALIPFQDTALRDTFLGFLGCYLSLVPLLVLTIFHFAISSVVKTPKNFFIVSVYILLTSFVMMLTQIDKGYFGFMFYKTGTNFITFILYSLTIYFTVISKKRMLKTGILLAFIIHISAVYISDILNINDGFFIHSTHYVNYYRLRGFCSESSWFAYTLVILGGMLITLFDNKIFQTVVGAVIGIVVLFSGSKGSIICIFIAMLYAINNYFKSKYITALIFIGSIIAIVGLLPFFVSLFSTDIDQFTSFATRGSSIIASFLIVLHYPLGTGFGAFTLVFREYLPEALKLLETFTGLRLNSAEIELYVLSDIYQQGATIKSVIFQWMSFFGIPFIYILLREIRRYYLMLKRRDEIKLLSLFVFFLVAILTYGHFMFESSVLIGYLIKTRKEVLGGEN